MSEDKRKLKCPWLVGCNAADNMFDNVTDEEHERFMKEFDCKYIDLNQYITEDEVRAAQNKAKDDPNVIVVDSLSTLEPNKNMNSYSNEVLSKSIEEFAATAKRIMNNRYYMLFDVISGDIKYRKLVCDGFSGYVKNRRAIESNPDFVYWINHIGYEQLWEGDEKFFVPGAEPIDEPYDGKLPKIILPMVKRTFPELVSSDLIQVQPMTGSTGESFKLIIGEYVETEWDILLKLKLPNAKADQVEYTAIVTLEELTNVIKNDRHWGAGETFLESIDTSLDITIVHDMGCLSGWAGFRCGEHTLVIVRS